MARCMAKLSCQSSLRPITLCVRGMHKCPCRQPARSSVWKCRPHCKYLAWIEKLNYTGTESQEIKKSNLGNHYAKWMEASNWVLLVFIWTGKNPSVAKPICLNKRFPKSIIALGVSCWVRSASGSSFGFFTPDVYRFHLHFAQFFCQWPMYGYGKNCRMNQRIVILLWWSDTGGKT